MCQLCNYETTTTKRDPNPARSFLKVVGRKRRDKIHRGAEYKVSPQTLRAEWRAINALKDEEEATLREALRRLFERQIRTLLDKLRERANLKKLATVQAKPELTPLVTSSLLNWNQWFERTGDVAREPLRQIIEAGYKTGGERLGITGVDFTSQSPRVRQTLDEIVFQTKNVQNTFRQMVSETIQRGLTEGDDLGELVERVAQKTQEQTGYRLRRTVRTAANGGFEAGQVDAYGDAGIKEMRWLSQRDGGVRSPSKGDKWDHRTADGQTVKLSANFLIQGRGGISESLKFPGDPSGSPGNVINCRCSTRPVS